MSPDDVQRARELVLERVAAGEGTLGSQVGSMLRKHGIDYNDGYAGLFDFLRREVPEVEWSSETGAGPKPITLRAPGAPPPAARGTTTVLGVDNAWRAWTSPAFTGGLVWDGASQALAVSHADAAAAEGSVRLSPPGTHAHQQIALAFLATLSAAPEEDRAKLENLASTSAPGWWVTWRGILNRLGVGEDWASFRVSEFERLFAEALASQGVAEEGVKQACERLRTARDAPRPSHHEVKRAQAPPLPGPATKSRRAAFLMALFDGLSNAELREVRVPLGAVLDALEAAGLLAEKQP